MHFVSQQLKNNYFFWGGGRKLPSKFIIKIWPFKVESSKPPKLTSDIFCSPLRLLNNQTHCSCLCSFARLHYICHIWWILSIHYITRAGTVKILNGYSYEKNSTPLPFLNGFIQYVMFTTHICFFLMFRLYRKCNV